MGGEKGLDAIATAADEEESHSVASSSNNISRVDPEITSGDTNDDFLIDNPLLEPMWDQHNGDNFGGTFVVEPIPMPTFPDCSEATRSVNMDSSPAIGSSEIPSNRSEETRTIMGEVSEASPSRSLSALC